MKCRFCQTVLQHEFIDLINAPPSNSYLRPEQLNEPEIFYPLKLFVCHECFLVQVDEYKQSGEIFDADYAYFSSYSATWLRHAQDYVNMIVERLRLNHDSQVMEIASNDGYLLQYMITKGIPCFGVEPARGTVEAAEEKGVETVVDFFGTELAQKLVNERGKQDLIIGNNVLAHVSDINDFVKGLKIMLADSGTITMEFPHLLNLIKFNQFDTIYHEHFSYLSLTTVARIFAIHGLKVYDAEKLSTHGGSLRIYAAHTENTEIGLTEHVSELKQHEKQFGLLELNTYHQFQNKANQVKHDFLSFLLDQKTQGNIVAAYGAAAKGNTLLNYSGIHGNDLIRFVVDASPHKQGKFLPGSHIPIVHEEMIRRQQPDVIVILAWNLREEISQQLDYIRDWGGQFAVPIPELQVFI